MRRICPAVVTLALVLPAVLPAGVSAQGIGVSAPQYDSPGAVVPAIVTAYRVPKDHRVTITARATSGATTTCVGDVWVNRVRKTASRKCYVRLPDRRGSYRLFGRAEIVAADGTVVGNRSGFASRPILADGYRSPSPMSVERIEQIERCFNPTSRVWLTFDDGGSRTQVRHILRTLAANDVKGRFFFTGAWADANPRLLAAIKQAGHLVANHSYTHPALSRVSAAEVGRQMSRGIAPTTEPRLLRPPFGAGALSGRLDRLAAARDYRLCRWTVDTYDWQGTTGARMAERVRFGDEMTPPISAGGNILMHGTAPHTSRELQLIIDAVRSEHLVLDPLR